MAQAAFAHVWALNDTSQTAPYGNCCVQSRLTNPSCLFCGKTKRKAETQMLPFLVEKKPTKPKPKML